MNSRKSLPKASKKPGKSLAAENARLKARLDGIKQRKKLRRARAERRVILQDLFDWMVKVSKV